MTDDRRSFLKKVLLSTGALALGGAAACAKRVGSATAGTAFAAESGSLAWITGADPYKATVAAVAKLGGIERFVKSGQRVALLPNIGWARTPEQGACTHPEVVRALIELCQGAGAKSMTVFCNPCGDMRVCLEKSGIGAMLEKTKTRFEYINDNGWKKYDAVQGCTHLKSAEVYRLVPDSDVLINCPVAKHHGGATLTMCCKNLMGLVRDRGFMHQKLHEAIADLTMMVHSDLCVLDASRILLRNGPSGGNVSDVERKDTVIAGVNPVEVDALGTTLFGKQPSEIGHLKLLGQRGMGQIDPTKLTVIRAQA